MQLRPLGATGLSVSAIAFGAGPVSGLFTAADVEKQAAVIARALQAGVNWFDTAATYGQGHSEAGLGVALARLRSNSPVHVATKVRVQLDHETDLRPLVVESVRQSLERLRLPRLTLVQIHNSITRNRNDQPTSITPEDVLGPTGLLAGLEDLRVAGCIEHFGLTGIGDADALNTVLLSGRFATIQAPLHLLNPSALRPTPAGLCDPDYGGFLNTAFQLGMGIFAIRVFAAGALLGAEPSSHTLKTPFFPLPLYRRDLFRARCLAAQLGSMESLREMALRYVLSLPQVSSAIVGFGAAEQIDSAAKIASLPALTAAELLSLEHQLDSVSRAMPPAEADQVE
ncbi:MAG: aldo/keto reductase [Planctomycetes bacterium]|nr:aldo/keto reductase [Planctomycetota bacterium]